MYAPTKASKAKAFRLHDHGEYSHKAVHVFQSNPKRQRALAGWAACQALWIHVLHGHKRPPCMTLDLDWDARVQPNGECMMPPTATCHLLRRAGSARWKGFGDMNQNQASSPWTYATHRIQKTTEKRRRKRDCRERMREGVNASYPVRVAMCWFSVAEPVRVWVCVAVPVPACGVMHGAAGNPMEGEAWWMPDGGWWMADTGCGSASSVSHPFAPMSGAHAACHAPSRRKRREGQRNTRRLETLPPGRVGDAMHCQVGPRAKGRGQRADADADADRAVGHPPRRPRRPGCFHVP
jgi:hypothetical protein